MYCVEHKGRRHTLYIKRSIIIIYYYYVAGTYIIVRFLYIHVAMNCYHFGGQTDFGMLGMDVAVLCHQIY